MPRLFLCEVVLVEGEIRAEIIKIDDDQRLIFGWASVVERHKVDKRLLVDLQGDAIALEDLEASVYDYMVDSRSADVMHERDHIGKIVESVVFTAEKFEKLGLKPDAMPLGWWVGFRIDDDEVWKGVKEGRYRMFSIRGVGTREPIEVADA